MYRMVKGLSSVFLQLGLISILLTRRHLKISSSPERIFLRRRQRTVHLSGTWATMATMPLCRPRNAKCWTIPTNWQRSITYILDRWCLQELQVTTMIAWTPSRRKMSNHHGSRTKDASTQSTTLAQTLPSAREIPTMKTSLIGALGVGDLWSDTRRFSTSTLSIKCVPRILHHHLLRS